MFKSEKLSKQARQIISDTKLRDSGSDVDTVRVWENYREQALLWRGISLLQIVVTLAAIISSMIFYQRQTINLNVPDKPLPGYYQAGQLPDAEFINVASDFVNLISTYQFYNAERQFKEATKYLQEPMLTKFEQEMLGTELNVIKETKRSQIYYVDDTKTEVERISPKEVKVVFSGERVKAITGQLMEPIQTKFIMVLTTIPRNAFNEYGIIVSSAELSKN